MTTTDPGNDTLGREPPEDAWRVGELNKEIERVLSDSYDRFPTHVVGEIAEVEEYDFGTFFDLRDPEKDPVISCLAWSSTIEDFEYELKEGIKAIVEVKVDFYPERGDCNLLVFDYWPLGESARYEELAERREQLSNEGLFDENKKRKIPNYPAQIGLVTSPSGSAREDVWAAVSDRSPRTRIKLSGATVQGTDAVESLVVAIQSLDYDSEVETIIVTRGGGADADLWCFNSEPLVRCVAECSTPIIAAVGHEDDETLVEHAADTRAMTPTQAGVKATTSIDTVLERVSGEEQRINNAYEALITTRIEQYSRRIESGYEGIKQRRLQRESHLQRAGDLEQRIHTAYQTCIDKRLDAIDTQIQSGFQGVEFEAESVAATKQAAQERVSDLESRIDAAYRAYINTEIEQIDRQISDGYKSLQAKKQVKTRSAEVKKLKIVVAVLIAILIFGILFVVLLLI